MSEQNPQPSPPSRAEEDARLEALRRYRLQEELKGDAFGRIVELCTRLFDVPTAFISAVEETRQWFKVRRGLDLTGGPNDTSFCAYAILNDGVTVVHDAERDARFARNPLVVGEPRIRFYAGAPLTVPGGHRVGTLSIADRRPRTRFSKAQRQTLKDLARLVVEALEHHSTRHLLDREVARHQRTNTILKGHRSELRALLDNVPDMVARLDRDARVLFVNAEVERFTGVPARVCTKATLFSLGLQQRFVAAASEAFDRVLRTSRAQTFEHDCLSDDRSVSLHVRLIPELDGAGSAAKVLAVATDVSARRQQERLGRFRGEVLGRIAQHAPLTDVLSLLTEYVEACHPNVCTSVHRAEGDKLTLEAPQSLPAPLRQHLTHIPVGAQGVALGSAAALKETVEVADIATDARWKTLHEAALVSGVWSCRARPILSERGDVVGVFSSYGTRPGPLPDDTHLVREAVQLAAIALSQRRLVTALEYRAYYDMLTDLPNRTLLRDRLEQSLLLAQQSGRVVAVLMVDISNFKVVNDSLGYPAGDAFLREVAARLMHCLRPGDTVARLGGDEFAAVLLLTRTEDSTVVLEKVLGVADTPVNLWGRSLPFSIRVGVSLFPEDGREAETLLQAAGSALHTTKNSVRERYRYYQNTMTFTFKEQLDLSRDLRRAASGGEFVLHYQPRVAATSGRGVGAEALVRWQHPTEGLLLPGSFLPIAERTDLMPTIDAWVLGAVLAQLASWQRAGCDLRLSCNLAAASFEEDGFVEDLIAQIKTCGAAAARLELEITEGLLMKDVTSTRTQLLRLKEVSSGITVAVDDFGTGHSSLAYLRHLPIDVLKIDRLFVSDLDHADASTRGDALKVIRSVTALAHDLGLSVVAEGVETAAQRDVLASVGCDELQGHYFAKPLTLGALRQFIARDPPT